MNNNSSLKGFNKIFNDAISDRIIEIGSKVIMKNKEYNEMSNVLTTLYDEIRSLLPDDKKCLMNQYEEVSNDQISLSERLNYEQGLKDGLQLKHILIYEESSEFRILES